MGLFDRLMQPQAPRRNLMDTQMVRRPSESYLRQDYPVVYGALGGLFGTAPDEMAGSVLDPNTAAVRRGAEYGFPVGTALGMLPAARFTKGLPVGMGIKIVDDAAIYKNSSVLINPKNIKPLNKIEDEKKYKNILSSMEESGYQGRPILAYMDKGQVKALTGSHRLYAARDAGIDVPVVFVKPSVMKWEDKEGLFGTFKESINDQRVYEHLKAAGDDTAASLAKLEDKVDQPLPYPQQAALDLTQQRAALPVSESPLMSIPSGLTRTEQANLIKNHAENFAAKAKEMGLSASVEHSGSKAGPSSYVTVLDPITGAKFESPFRFSGHSKGPKESQFVYDVGDDFSNELGALEKMALSIPKSERDAIQSARQAKMIEDLALQEKERIFSQGRPLIQSAMQEANLQQTPYTKAFSNSGKYIGANELDYPSNPMYTDPLGYSIR